MTKLGAGYRDELDYDCLVDGICRVRDTGARGDASFACAIRRVSLGGGSRLPPNGPNGQNLDDTLPFFQGVLKTYTIRSVQDITKLGYTYDTLPTIPTSSQSGSGR